MSPNRRRLLLAGAWLLSLSAGAGISFQAGRSYTQRPKQSKLQINPFDGRSFYEEDEDEDGRPDAQHFVDKDRRHLESRFDRNEDGIPELVRFYHLDGHVSREEQDTDYNGQLDRWEDLDESGGTKHAKYDLDGDGKADMESFYDENGGLARTVTSRDGQIADETHYENDLSTRSLVDVNRDGRFDTEVLYDDLGIFREIRKLKR